ncbi:MAG: ATP-binding cassette domain-containing protein, partial [Neisseriaceae bacterium]|nr:ATP-binding cassette domain-containing protein [Neisseriaceae bacterium]
MIQFKHVSKTFSQDGKAVEALKGVNLTIDTGDIYGLVGYSGAGKSTLLRLINVLEQPSSGEVWVDGALISGYNAAELRHAKRDIG